VHPGKTSDAIGVRRRRFMLRMGASNQIIDRIENTGEKAERRQPLQNPPNRTKQRSNRPGTAGTDICRGYVQFCDTF
jgi:hypothetical protein